MRRWCELDNSQFDCYGNPLLRLSKVSDQVADIKKAYHNNLSLRDCTHYYDILTSEMIIKRTPPQVIPLGEPGVVVANFMEYQSDLKFAVKWPEHAA